jgi:hypothetical protein
VTQIRDSDIMKIDIIRVMIGSVRPVAAAAGQFGFKYTAAQAGPGCGARLGGRLGPPLRALAAEAAAAAVTCQWARPGRARNLKLNLTCT